VEGSFVKPTNFHDLQLTLHLVIVAVLFELLFEAVDLGGLQYFASGLVLKKLENIHSPNPELRGCNPRFSSSGIAPEYLLKRSAIPRL
jgi:hypothetical protein